MEKLAADAAPQLWFDVPDPDLCVLTDSSLRDDVEVHLNRFAYVAGIITDDQVDGSDLRTARFKAVLFAYFYDLLCDWILVHLGGLLPG